MHVALSCHGCQHRWSIEQEPQHLLDLTCPACAAQPDLAAAEDLASALEDALAQLWRLHQHMGVAVSFSSDAIPPAFDPTTSTQALPNG